MPTRHQGIWFNNYPWSEIPLWDLQSSVGGGVEFQHFDGRKILGQSQGKCRKNSFTLPHHLDPTPGWLSAERDTSRLWIFPQEKEGMKWQSSFPIICETLPGKLASVSLHPEQWGHHSKVHACVLSHFSCVWLFANLCTVAHQVPLSMGFSRQEYWTGLPCPSPADLPNPGIEPTSLMFPALAGGFFTKQT